MPVRSLSSAVFRWPAREEVLAAARRWAAELRARDENVVRVLCCGSCARGADYGVGSDIDLIVVVRAAPDSIVERRRTYEPKGLPVPEDLWVYTEREWADLADGAPHVWRRVQREAVDLGVPEGAHVQGAEPAG